MTLLADNQIPETLDGVVFRAESSTDSFKVLLDSDGRPKEIQQTTPLGKGIRAEYSDYKLEKGSYVPTRIMILWPGEPQQGISILLSTFELGPDKSKDSAMLVKKRRRLW